MLRLIAACILGISSSTVKNTPAEVIAIIMFMDVIFWLEENIVCFIRTCHCRNPWMAFPHEYEDVDMTPFFFPFSVIFRTDFKMEAN